MSEHLPASLPLRARIKSTLNLRPAVRATTVNSNQTARRVVDHLHDRILANPEKHQRYTHQEVGEVLGIDPKKVRLSLAHAGARGITLEVTAKDRAAIKQTIKEQRIRA